MNFNLEKIGNIVMACLILMISCFKNFDHGLQPPGKGDPVLKQGKYVIQVVDWILKTGK